MGAPAGQPAVGPASRYFELDRVADAALMRMPSDVRVALGVRQPSPLQSSAPAEPTVLLLLRSRQRRMGGVRTGSLAEVLHAMCAEPTIGRRVVVDNFDGATLRHQVEATSRAGVLIGVHGAQLTGVMWMREGAALLEVMLRYGWCCSDEQLRIARQRGELARKRAAASTSANATRRSLQLGDYPAPPKCVCGGYNKPDYANMAHTFGVRYAYYDPPYVEPPQSLLLDRPSVLVNGAELARAARLLLEP